MKHLVEIAEIFDFTPQGFLEPLNQDQFTELIKYLAKEQRGLIMEEFDNETLVDELQWREERK